MACPSVLTGDQFLATVLDHIDCQAQTLGSYGYLALSEPGSVASVALSGLLTLFIALFGIRMLFGPAPGAGDAVGGILKIAIVLTLALSWPAWKAVAYDLVLQGPAEIADKISPPSLPYSSEGGFASRLQNIDTGMVALTVHGTGRNIGELTEATSSPAGFREIALEDDTGLASARLIFLSSTIGSLAIVRIAAGLLLALAPLAAGLLLFEATRGLFSGWLRGLVLTMLGSIGITVVLAAELAVLEPWLADALRLRSLGYATPAAPTELMALTAAFALALFGMLFLFGKIAFQRGWPAVVTLVAPGRHERPGTPVQPPADRSMLAAGPPSRAFLISERMTMAVRQEEKARLALLPGSSGANQGADPQVRSGRAVDTGGSRTFRRVSAAAIRRDERS